jgi:type IV pilus assembly protein PilC
MASFSYRARNLTGQIINGRIQADNAAAVIGLLRARNLFVVQVNPVQGEITLNLDRLLKRKINLKTVAIFCRQFATLNQAGIPILQCLNILAKQTEDGRMRSVLQNVALEIERGKSLSDAFRLYKEKFPEIFLSMIVAGELSGNIDQAMERLALNFEKECGTRDKIRAAMTYPTLIGILAVCAVAFLLIFIVPVFVDVFKSLGATLPLPTRMLLAVSSALQRFWWIILPLLFVVLPVGFRQALATRQGRRIWDRFLLRLPVVGPMVTKSAVARFARSLATLLKSGIPLMRALETTEEIVGNSVAADDIAEARANIKEGERMAPILARSSFFPPMAVSMVAVGEESGSLDAILEKMASFYEGEVDAMIASLSSIIEPLMIVCIGGVVGFIAISIYLPLFGMAGAMQQGAGVP